MLLLGKESLNTCIQSSNPFLEVKADNESAFGLWDDLDDASIIGSMQPSLEADNYGSRGSTVKRRRRDFSEMDREHGSNFRKACRMSRHSFCKLHDMLEPKLAMPSNSNLLITEN